MRNALCLASLALLLSACVGVPEGLTPVSAFDVDRYLGRWYEIARLDHSFERGLTNVSAEYGLREDGSVSVLNQGYSTRKGRWDSIEGRALFVGESDVGSLKVSFFGPFFGGYNVIVLDEDYRYALVCGPNRDFLWILAREPTLSATVRERLVAQAAEWEFPVDELIWVSHEPPPTAR
ncbi:MAG: lipocalin family protein [Pseudomonadota bacterium]